MALSVKAGCYRTDIPSSPRQARLNGSVVHRSENSGSRLPSQGETVWVHDCGVLSWLCFLVIVLLPSALVHTDKGRQEANTQVPTSGTLVAFSGKEMNCKLKVLNTDNYTNVNKLP